MSIIDQYSLIYNKILLLYGYDDSIALLISIYNKLVMMIVALLISIH